LVVTVHQNSYSLGLPCRALLLSRVVSWWCPHYVLECCRVPGCCQESRWSGAWLCWSIVLFGR